MHYNDSNTPPPRLCRRINRTHTSKNNMEQKSNMQSHTTTPPCSIRPGRNLSKRSPAYSCTLRERWIQLCSPHSALSHPSRQLPRRTRCKTASNFWTTPHHRKMPSSLTEQATRNLQFTVMRPTCRNKKLAAELAATCLWQARRRSPSTTGQY